MAHEQAFEENGETKLPASHREWHDSLQAEPDIAQMVEMYDVMTLVNQRLAEHRAQPLRRTIGDALAGCSLTLLALNLFDPNDRFNLVVPPILLAIWLYNRNLHTLDITRAALNLQEFDKRWIGPLFEALSWPNSRIRKIVRLKLLNLLPMLTESDSPYLNERHRIAINAILETSNDTELKLAILKAIVRFGDASSVAVVERLANTPGRFPAIARVRREALICLPRLREQALKQAARISESASSLGRLSIATDDRMLTHTEVQPSDAASAQTDSALAKLEAEREKVSSPAMRMAFLVANWCVIVPYTCVQSVLSFTDHAPLQGCVWAAAAIGASQLYRVALSRTRVDLLRKQAQQRDVKAVGALAEALFWPEQDLQYEAASALTVLLPQLKANQASLLSASQRECLHAELKLQNAQSQSDLMIAILRAFQQVGDTAAIPYVEALANAKWRTPHEHKVVLEAQECLPYLRLCAGNNTASHSLLRASSMTDTAAADNLLRPSWIDSETKPEQLLRPSDNDVN